ncbi:uncharacterized protein LOC118425909 [Branchiostoma floridae]|uniref:Uncharacterized protein LOC118425909 n=1 Tax=Branchiostoma floridae TaxID=7739 RepID=A0A9J7LXW6_BRAFL|nr:uncharacterized protein LOC118425909 [Branchiostoma floridae]
MDALYARVSEAIAAIPNDTVVQLFGELPTTGGNDAGKPARSALVSKLKSSTPGRHTEMFGSGDRFVDIFFPNHSSAPYEGDTSLTGLDNNWWSDFSVAALCQAMYNLTKDLRKQLKSDDINNAVNNKNTELKTHSMLFYAKVFSDTFIKTTYHMITDKASAKQHYVSALTSDAWITAKRAIAAEGMWTDAAWELYHHWVKLHLLGASNDEIDGIIKQLSSKELPIPPEVGVGSWTSYMAWMNPAAITHQDIEGDSANGILKTVPITVITPGPYPAPPTMMKEENSFEFTADGQPGRGYRTSGGGGGGGGGGNIFTSCFSRDTIVLLADGTTLLPIRSVEVGQDVFTLQGPRRVAVVSTPRRKGRLLYSINGCSFSFTETHPFVTATGHKSEDGHGLAAVSPRTLVNLVPTLSRLGVTKMEEGTTVLSLKNREPHPTPVSVLEEHPATAENADDYIYDLILEPTDDDGFPHYVVGDGTSMFLVASEVPRIEIAPYLATTVLKALHVAHDSLHGRPIQRNNGEPPSKVPHVFQLLTPALALVSPLQQAQEVVQQTQDPAPFHLADVLKVFVQEKTAPNQTSYRRELGEACEQIATHHGEEIDAMVDLGWRKIGKEEKDGSEHVLAVSILDVIFHDVPNHSPGERLAVNVEAKAKETSNEAWCEESDYKNSSTFVRHCRKVFYFQDVDVDDESLVEIHFHVHHLGEKRPLPYTARALVPGALEHNYRMFEALLREEDEHEVGLVSFDVRLLSLKAMQEEQKRSKTWNDDDRRAFALELGQRYGELLKLYLDNSG